MNAPKARGFWRQPWYYVVLMSFALMLNYMDRSILAVLMVPLQPALHLSDTDVGLLTGFAFVLVYAVLGLPLARLADRRSRHTVVGLGILVWSIATLSSGLVSSALGLLAARAGVGAGEAAGTAASLSLVSDQYRKERVPLVLAIVNAAGALGTAIGLGVGGAIAQRFGWRSAFVCAGLPGLLLGSLVLATLTDERLERGGDSLSILVAMPSIRSTARFVLLQRSIIFTLIGSVFLGAMVTVVTSWTPMFFSRVHHLPLGRIGVTLGTIKGLSGLVGALAGGLATSALTKRSDQWLSLWPAIACFAAVPVYLLFVLAPTSTVAFVAMGAGIFLVSSVLGPVFAIYQCTALPRLRSQVSSLHILVASLGIGGGPLLVGYLNDGVLAARGPLALQVSLLIVPLSGVLAGLSYALASRSICGDVRRAMEWSDYEHKL